jgi:hypothetical protein
MLIVLNDLEKICDKNFSKKIVVENTDTKKVSKHLD